MSRLGQPDAAQSPAWLLWIIQHGPAKLFCIVRVYIRKLQQTLLPQLWKHLRQIPSLSLATVWLAARRCFINLVHARVPEFLQRVLAAWLHHCHRLKQCFDNGWSRQAYPRHADRKAECSSSLLAESNDSSKDRQATIFVLLHTIRSTVRQ